MEGYINNSFSSGAAQYQHGFPHTGINIVPRLDVVDSDSHIIYIFDIPGADASKLNLEVSPTEVVISAPTETHTPPGTSLLYQERPKGSYTRIVSPPANVNIDEVSADYKNGVLLVRFPKQKRNQPKGD